MFAKRIGGLSDSAPFLAVIPAKAGIHNFQSEWLWSVWIPAFAGMTVK